MRACIRGTPGLRQKTFHMAALVLQVGGFVAVEGSKKLRQRLDEITAKHKLTKMLTASDRYIHEQSVWNGKEQDPKTQNAVRDVDICSNLAALLKDYIGNRTDGFLFHADSGKPLLQRNVLRDGLNPILKKLNLKQDGKAFHSFRRFRVMHLRKNRVPWDLEKFWIGHANKDVTDKYAAQLKEDVEWRKDVAEKTGLGLRCQ